LENTALIFRTVDSHALFITYVFKGI
jgi:hypothetical protein